MKSLHRFMWEKKLPAALRFDLNMPSTLNVTHRMNYNNENVSVTFQLISLPLFMAEQSPRVYQLLARQS